MYQAIATSDTPSLSIVVPVYNCRDLTRACFSSLVRSIGPGVEIVVIDDASDRDTRTYLESLTSPFRVFRNEVNGGYAKAVNFGVRKVRSERVLFLNSDTVLSAGWIDPMRALLDRDDRIGAVGNIQINPGTGLVDHAGVFFDPDGMPTHAHKNRARPPRGEFRERHAISGACMLMHTNLFREIGGFDETYLNGMEDIDLCVRLCMRGYRILVSHRSVILHHVSQSPGRHDHDDANSRLFASRRAGSAATWGRSEWPVEYLRRYARHWWRFNPRLFLKALWMTIGNTLTSS